MDGSGVLHGVGGTQADAEALLASYMQVRSASLALAAPLSAEDQQVQSMPDASPTKWHLAHTTWFFETFLLVPHLPGYQPFDPAFAYLFNSYYEAVGPRHPRPSRGLLTRPSLEDVHRYRAHVDHGMEHLLAHGAPEVAHLVTLGLNHEQQHQELILMDIKHLLSLSPLRPAYAPRASAPRPQDRPLGWLAFNPGLVEIGAADAGFTFDNEGPRHRLWLDPFRLADRLVTCGEWLAFIEAGGYHQPHLWLSDGRSAAVAQGWEAPLYWRRTEGEWLVFTLEGEQPFDPEAPVCHVSFYEADAFARWSGRRLPTEAEWEVAAASTEASALSSLALHPAGAGSKPGLRQAFDGLWQWTSSAYAPYPRYRPAKGALGEYNGKFMSGQMVLRGGACVTPPGHTRITYRNFFPPAARWAFSGVRLADDD